MSNHHNKPTLPEKAALAYLACQPDGTASEGELKAFDEWAKGVIDNYEGLHLLISGDIGMRIIVGHDAPSIYITDQGARRRKGATVVDTTLDKLIEAMQQLANIAFCNAESCDGFTEEEGARIEKYEWFRDCDCDECVSYRVKEQMIALQNERKPPN